MSGHTPGPWYAERTRLDGHEWFVRSACRNLPPLNWKSRFDAKLDPLWPLNGKHVNAHGGRPSSDEGCCETAISENAANARLIAAAPELFEYVASSALAGCATAAALIAKVAVTAGDGT